MRERKKAVGVEGFSFRFLWTNDVSGDDMIGSYHGNFPLIPKTDTDRVGKITNMNSTLPTPTTTPFSSLLHISSPFADNKRRGSRANATTLYSVSIEKRCREDCLLTCRLACRTLYLGKTSEFSSKRYKSI